MSRLKLRTVLASVFLLILALPLTGFFALKVYESALVRQTESELIGQAALLTATYSTLFVRLAGKGFDYSSYGQPPPQQSQSAYDRLGQEALAAAPMRYAPRPARLDLTRDPVFAPAPEPLPALRAADAVALAVGAELQPVLLQAQRVTLAGLRVVAANGVVVASSGDDLGLSLAHQREVADALRGEVRSLLRARKPVDLTGPSVDGISRTTALRVWVAMPVLAEGRVIGAVLLMRTPANLWQVLWARRGVLALLVCGLLATTLALAWLTATTLTQPLRQLAAQAQRASAGERGAVRPARRRVVQEVAELSDTIAAMAAALEARADYIKDFAAHVSHEFKTPLTAIGGAAELLREHGDAMEPAERARFFDILSKDTQRLSRLTGRLLELARADMATATQGDCLALPVVQAAVARAADQGQNVQLASDSATALRLPMPAEMLDSIVSGLLDNARQHAPGAAVELSLQQQASDIVLRLADDGPGVSAANAEKIFTPFFTTARSQGNTGLGLAIIRALVAAQGGSIALLPSAKGSVFELRWPA